MTLHVFAANFGGYVLGVGIKGYVFTIPKIFEFVQLDTQQLHMHFLLVESSNVASIAILSFLGLSKLVRKRHCLFPAKTSTNIAIGMI
jgi:hypothetical protein